jgi:hypothetical protein
MEPIHHRSRSPRQIALATSPFDRTLAPSLIEYLSPERAAQRLGLKVGALSWLRRTGKGPRYIRVGVAVRYRADWLDQWSDEQAVSSTSEERARRRA